MKNIKTPLLSFIVVSSFLFMLIASEDTDAREKFDQGEADTSLSFYQGLTEQVSTVQAKFNNVIECDNCKDAAYEMRTRCKKILKSMRKAKSIGDGGAEFKRLAIDFTQCAIDVADDIINNDDYYDSYVRINEAEEVLISYASIYAADNGITIMGTLDPDEYDD